MTGVAAPAANGDRALARPSARLVAAFAVVTVALLVGGFLFYRSQERYQRDDVRAALTAVSVLKVDEISRWRETLLSDATVMQHSHLAGYILRYLSAPTADGPAVLRSGLLAWQENKSYPSRRADAG